jgi:methylenetetrahydrofolate reductase (NADPH)
LISCSAAKRLAKVKEPVVIPTFERPYRLSQKIKAGANICFINHSGEPETYARFISEVQALGTDVPFVAGLAVVTSEESAKAIQSFHNFVVPEGYLENILASPDPRKAGIRAAIKFGEALLSQPGVSGLNLSSVPEPGRERELARDLAEIARAFL